MRRIHELYCTDGVLTQGRGIQVGEDAFAIPGYRKYGGNLRVNILAMGDVGGTLALAMKLTGADIISKIGICDIKEAVLSRWEHELNQITMPNDPDAFPQVKVVNVNDVFDCDVFLFCASHGVPDLSQAGTDVRMAQLEQNREMIGVYGKQAAACGFDGEFFVVSDPVDPLCKAVAENGIDVARIQGFGLGVMNARAMYYARQNKEFVDYLTKGRVFGPHGEDLVVADNIYDYHEDTSLKLTELTTSANVRIRELGFKPFIAPAVSSGALSILENLRGHWHYSSACFGNAFLGMLNKRNDNDLLVEDLPLDERLFRRIEAAYRNLEEL